MNSKSKAIVPVASRRQFVLGASAAVAASFLPAAQVVAQNRPGTKSQEPVTLSGEEINLEIGYQTVNFTGARRLATAVNGSVPAPTIRLKEGQHVTINVTNTLEQDSSIHWHGIILPSEMDGVPGMSFGGIKPGETFTYRYNVNQSGTYWYHSHSGFQEQTGLYGALIVDPAEPDSVPHDRDHVVLLSDWTDEDPHRVYAKLKKLSHYYNFNERTLGDWWRDVKTKGFGDTWRDRQMWNQMRMSNTDISDVTAATYTYLMNGVTPDTGWYGLFNKGEKVRLRFINASAMTIFDVRIPGLKMTVVAADGQNVQPVDVDEFRIGIAETYDVIVEPDDKAYTLFAQNIDRSGYTRGTLTPDMALQAVIPAMDPPVTLSHGDMGMAHEGHEGMGHSGHGALENGSGNNHGSIDHGQMDHGSTDHGSTDHGSTDHGSTDHGSMDHGSTDHGSMDHGSMDHGSMDHGSMNHGSKQNNTGGHSGHGQHGASQASDAEPVVDHSEHGSHNDHSAMPPPPKPVEPGHAGHGSSQNGMQEFHVQETNLGKAGFGSTAEIVHVDTEFGPHVDMRADAPADGLHDPGVGLRDHQERYGRKVLTYADLRNAYPTQDRREPGREIQIHLTGNMGRYMWSMNGIKHADAAPIVLHYGERVRIVLVNDTMMTHPIHLHGMWSELETGDPEYIPRKHTILVQPGAKVSYLVTADAKGRWAYHCHLLFHMPGMMREVAVY